MFKRILLPVDLSQRHQRALDTAAELARQSGAEIILLHLIEVIQGLGLEEEKDFYQRLKRVAQKHLDKLHSDLQTRNVPARTEILFGHRGPEIVRYASEMAADLIVLTAPRLDPNNPAVGWGSLSYKISLLALCPVLLVK